MKTYVITLSKKFPKSHKRAGEETQFMDKLLNGTKKHTIRANFALWKHRIEEVQQGNAVLSIRQWDGVPYRSRQTEIARLTAKDGVGVQELFISNNMFAPEHLCPLLTNDGQGFYKNLNASTVAENDGLCREDWEIWFHKYDLSKQFAIIHFTNFRY